MGKILQLKRFILVFSTELIISKNQLDNWNHFSHRGPRGVVLPGRMPSGRWELLVRPGHNCQQNHWWKGQGPGSGWESGPTLESKCKVNIRLWTNRAAVIDYESFLIHGFMESTTYHPCLNITLIPKVLKLLFSSTWAYDPCHNITVNFLLLWEAV